MPLADYPICMHQSLWLKIISKVKSSSLQLRMIGKRQGEKILQILFYIAQQKHCVAYLKIPRRWSLQAKNAFSSKQSRMEVIHEHFHGRCGDACSGEWLKCALEVLQEMIFIYPPCFSTAVLFLRWNGQY